MKLKVFTLEYLKKKGKIKRETLKEINIKLCNAENEGDLLGVDFLKNKIQQFEDEYIHKEWEKQKEFTLLEDEKPSKAFLNIESRKMGYNDIDKLKIVNPENPNTKIESTDQEVIRSHARSFYQKIYNEQHKVTPNKDDIKNFLLMDDDNAPWDSFQKRKLPKELIESMEGDLTMDELHEALFSI